MHKDSRFFKSSLTLATSFSLLIAAIPIGVRWYPAVILTCISLEIRDRSILWPHDIKEHSLCRLFAVIGMYVYHTGVSHLSIFFFKSTTQPCLSHFIWVVLLDPSKPHSLSSHSYSRKNPDHVASLTATSCPQRIQETPVGPLPWLWAFRGHEKSGMHSFEKSWAAASDSCFPCFFLVKQGARWVSSIFARTQCE